MTDFEKYIITELKVDSKYEEWFLTNLRKKEMSEKVIKNALINYTLQKGKKAFGKDFLENIELYIENNTYERPESFNCIQISDTKEKEFINYYNELILICCGKISYKINEMLLNSLLTFHFEEKIHIKIITKLLEDLLWSKIISKKGNYLNEGEIINLLSKREGIKRVYNEYQEKNKKYEKLFASDFESMIAYKI